MLLSKKEELLATLIFDDHQFTIFSHKNRASSSKQSGKLQGISVFRVSKQSFELKQENKIINTLDLTGPSQ
jgi:hypothetical protein